MATDFDPGHSIESARRVLAARLQSAGIEQPALDARLLVGAALRLDLTGMVTQAGRQLAPEEAARLEAYAQRRLAHEPVARILGAREFWGLPFQLSEATLVPRPDTEAVVPNWRSRSFMGLRIRDGARASPISAPDPAPSCSRCCTKFRAPSASAPISV
ncbi:methylase of polypeptide subunit release factors [Bradyrhizobium sp. GM5.1]